MHYHDHDCGPLFINFAVYPHFAAWAVILIITGGLSYSPAPPSHLDCSPPQSIHKQVCVKSRFVCWSEFLHNHSNCIEPSWLLSTGTVANPVSVRLMLIPGNERNIKPAEECLWPPACTIGLSRSRLQQSIFVCWMKWIPCPRFKFQESGVFVLRGWRTVRSRFCSKYSRRRHDAMWRVVFACAKWRTGSDHDHMDTNVVLPVGGPFRCWPVGMQCHQNILTERTKCVSLNSSSCLGSFPSLDRCYLLNLLVSVFGEELTSVPVPLNVVCDWCSVPNPSDH